MNRKIKALGLALVASLALTAVTASAAAAAGTFTSSSTHTILSGQTTTTHSFTAGSGFGAITCTVTFSGTSSALSETDQTIIPTYRCGTDSFGRTVDVDNEGLTYTYTANTNAGGTSDVHVSGGLKLTVTNSSGVVVCTVTLANPQTNNGVTYKNLGGTKGVELTSHTTNVRSTVEGGFFNCGTSATTATAGATTSSAVLTGKDTAGNPVEINVDVE